MFEEYVLPFKASDMYRASSPEPMVTTFKEWLHAPSSTPTNTTRPNSSFVSTSKSPIIDLPLRQPIFLLELLQESLPPISSSISPSQTYHDHEPKEICQPEALTSFLHMQTRAQNGI